jgi:protein phosphatase
MPWSVKARELLLTQYAATGAAAATALGDAVGALEAAAARGIEVDGIAETYRQRLDLANRYIEAYRGYCWPVESIRDIRIAPFHLLATEGKVYDASDHVWQMETLAKLAAASDGMLIPTSHRVVELTNQAQESVAIKWWESNTASGAEGMVVKPQSFVARGPKGLVQPGVKCRGKAYLRIIYGPEYSLPDNLDRLRNRGLGLKRSLALREFALGIEGLERFVRREPLRRVHECVFGVLALESEPVDPRL